MVTVDIRTLIVNRGGPNKPEVHVEPNADLVDFRSNPSGRTFTDPSLFLPVDVSERVKLEAIRETVRAGSEGDELIGATVSQTSSPEFQFQLTRQFVGRTDTRERGTVGGRGVNGGCGGPTRTRGGGVGTNAGLVIWVSTSVIGASLSDSSEQVELSSSSM
jgi:hypothetical protein